MVSNKDIILNEVFNRVHNKYNKEISEEKCEKIVFKFLCEKGYNETNEGLRRYVESDNRNYTDVIVEEE